MPSKQIELSVIVTAHHEGIVTHKTVLSVFRALEPLDKQSISYEIIVHLDNPDEPTHAYFQQYKKDARFKIFENSFGNPADSRNFAIEKASGKYIAIIDGDDMMSRNWLIDGYQIFVKHKEPIVLRPHFKVDFGTNSLHTPVWIIEGSFSKEEDAIIMSYYNRWPSMFMATASIFKNIPYKPTLNGFGYEDWLFNCEVVDAGIPNIVVPNSVMFYRLRANSVTSIDHAGAVLPYTKLFDIDYIKSLDAPAADDYKPASTFSRLKQGGKNAAFSAVKQIPALRKLVTPAAQKLLYNRQMARLPQGLIDAWKDINSIDGELYPAIETIVGVRFHPLSFNQHDTRYGNMYKRMVDQVTKKPDYLFLLPELAATGGTEKLVSNYITAMSKAHPDWHFAILSAKPKKSAFEFPKNVDFIDFEGIVQDADQYVRDMLWSRLLIQLGVKRLHIISHEWWYRWVIRHKTLLSKNNYVVNISMFMREYTPYDGRVLSFADPWLREIYPVVNKVFTDNRNIINEMLEANAFDPQKLVLHHQPAALEITKPKDIVVSPSKPLRILWASRLSYQKRVDIVKEIAKKLDPKKFHIDVYGREQHYRGGSLAGIPSLTYKGDFTGIASIPTHEYDAYLYTSAVDGIPNVLLEIVALGVPIIASNDGGVGEVIINNETGQLIDIEDVDGYIAALEQLRSQPKKAKKMAEAAQALLLSQHSVKQFEKKVAKDIT